MRRAAYSSTAVLTAAGLMLAGCGYDPFAAPDSEGDQAPSNAGTEEPPTFGEVRDEAFTAMLEADSVDILGEVEAGDAELDELFDGIDEDTSGQLQISGELDGSQSEMRFSAGGSSFTQRAVEGEEYFRGEDFAALLVSELDNDVADLVDEEFIAEVVADQWVQFDDAQDPSVFSAEDFITTWQQELEGEEVSEMEAEPETRGDQSVWVYTADGGDSEFVVAAEGEPYLLSIRDGDSHYQFSDWNDSPAPEVPEDVITLDEIFDAIAEEQGWTLDDTDEPDPETESD